MKAPVHRQIILLAAYIFVVINPSIGSPTLRKCVFGDALLNSLVGSTGVQQKDDYVAEENVLGWSSGPLDGVAGSNLTESELNDCLQEYVKGSANVVAKPLPPGVTPEKDPSRQPYLPPAAGKDVLIDSNGNGHGEYYTTYDGSKYKFKEKGFVIDPPSSSTQPPPTPKPTPTDPKPTSKPSGVANSTKLPGNGSNKKNKDELELWYKAFVSVMSKYM